MNFVMENKTVEGAEIDLPAKDYSYLGPNLVLKNCQITLPSAKGLSFNNVTFLDCHIRAKKQFSNFQDWCRCRLQDCTFLGHFRGNDFGNWPEALFVEGATTSCDFSKAKLDSCRFVDCIMTRIKLPVWPCFAILNPVKRSKELLAFDWPGTLAFWAQGITMSPNNTAAHAAYAPNIAKLFDATDAELQDALVHLGGVVM